MSVRRRAIELQCGNRLRLEEDRRVFSCVGPRAPGFRGEAGRAGSVLWRHRHIGDGCFRQERNLRQGFARVGLSDVSPKLYVAEIRTSAIVLGELYRQNHGSLAAISPTSLAKTAAGRLRYTNQQSGLS